MVSKRIFVLVSLLLVSFLLVGCGTTPPIVDNHAPVITSTPVTTATVGVAYTYDVNATDPDGDTLTYSLATPGGMTINSASGLITWIPTPAQIGDNSVTVKVSDKSLSVTQSFKIKVGTLPPVNHAPVITSIPVTTATVGVTYIYDVNATDPDGDVLTYSLTTKPNGMVINSANGLISWVPTSVQTGLNWVVIVSVSDGTLSDFQGFNIVVSEPTVPPTNQAPIIISTPITVSTVGIGYVYEVKAFDPEGDVLTYSLTTKPGGMAISPSTGKITWAPTTKGNYAVTVKAFDGKLSGTQSFTITVSEPSVPPVNQKPVINSYPITTAIVGETYTYTIHAFDPDGDILTYSVIDIKPIGMTINPANGFIWWTPTSTQIGDNLITVMVSDGALSDTQSFIVKVSEPEPEPEPEPGLTEIIVDPKEMDLIVGGFGTFKVTAYYDNDTTNIVTFKCIYGTSNSSIAYVAHGIDKVTTLTVGTATIFISYTQLNFLTGEEITKTDEIDVTVSEPAQETITIRWLEDAIRCHPDGEIITDGEWFNDLIPPIVEGELRPPATLILTDGGYHFADIQEYFNWHMYPEMGLEGSVVIDETGALSGWATYTLYGLPTRNDFVGQVGIIFDETINWSEVSPPPAEIPYDYDGIMVGNYTQLKYAYADNLVHQGILNEKYPKAVPAPEQGQFWWYVQYTDYTAHGGK